MRSALRDDPDPLLRLNLLSEGLIPNVPNEGVELEGTEEIDEVLFFATSCEETRSRGSGRPRRAADARKRSRP